MIPKERETILWEGGTPDRVPIWQINGIVAAHYFGYAWNAVRGDAKLSVDLMRRFTRLSGTDIMAPGVIETNAMILDLPGTGVKFQDDNYLNVTSHYFAGAEDVESKELYDPSDPKEAKNLWKYHLDKIALMAEIEDEFSVNNTSWGVFTAAGLLRDVETLMMDIMMEPDIAHKVVDRATVLVDEVVRAGMETGCDNVHLTDPMGSGSLIPGETFEEYASPHLKRMIAGYKKDYNAPTYLICGDSVPDTESLSELGMALFAFYPNDNVTELRKRFGTKTILAGNLDPLNVIWRGTPESVMRASKKCLEDARGTRFVLATGGETPRDTSLENLRAMLAASKKYSDP